MATGNRSEVPSIEWADPPANKADDRRSTFWRAIATELKKNPSRWAKVQTYKTRSAAASKVTRINNGKMVGLGAGNWEAKHRGNGNEEWDLYLRLVPEDTDEVADDSTESGPISEPISRPFSH